MRTCMFPTDVDSYSLLPRRPNDRRDELLALEASVSWSANAEERGHFMPFAVKVGWIITALFGHEWVLDAEGWLAEWCPPLP
jgi:hypothetical protein